MAVVKIEQGVLSGKLETTSTNKSFASFRGIPYGKPPIGELRFQAPQPAEKWDGIRDATEHGPCCPQWHMETNRVLEGNEDCLSLNIYTPDINGSLKPVMVWFHGGGFQSGYADSSVYGPDYLVDEDVVLVTVNYRLEVLGFLCLDTKEVPGNAGMKDQVLALKWVQKNISCFGGDPGNVTIFGESSGSVGLTYHYISPMSQGLFHKIICQSGVFLNNWVMAFDHLNRAFRLGKHLGKETEDVEELLAFLRSLDPLKIAKVSLKIVTPQERYASFPLLFTPVVEKTFEDQESFLPKPPIKLLEERKFHNVPILLGYNNLDGIIALKRILNNAPNINEDFSLLSPVDVPLNIPEKHLTYLGDEIKMFYYGNKSIGKDTMLETTDMLTDVNFSYGIIKMAQILSVQSTMPVYLYKFSADTNLNLSKANLGFKIFQGAVHVDDRYYIFKAPVKADDKSWKIMKRMTRLWSNFAKYGNPTPHTDEFIQVKWKPVTPEIMHYLDISLELKNGIDVDKNKYDFWKKIYNYLEQNNIKPHL